MLYQKDTSHNTSTCLLMLMPKEALEELFTIMPKVLEDRAILIPKMQGQGNNSDEGTQ